MSDQAPPKDQETIRPTKDKKPTEAKPKTIRFKGRKAMEYRGTKCLNCGHPLKLSDVYCSYCGQLNTKKNLALTDFIAEFVGSIITYDSRFNYTLRDLMLKPGVITRNYVQGQRLKYANPFRFFLSVSIIYFLIQGILASVTGTNTWFKENNSVNNKEINFGPSDKAKIFTKEHLDTLNLDSMLRSQSPELDLMLKNKNIPGMAQLDSALKRTNPEQDSIKQLEDSWTATQIDSANKRYHPFALNDAKRDSLDYISEVDLDTLGWTMRTVERFMLYRDFYKLTDITDPYRALDSLKHSPTTYNRFVYNKNESIDRIIDSPSNFITYLMNKIPFFVFFFAPLYALFFLLFYAGSEKTYMEHLVFIFHIFSFVFVGMLLALLPDIFIFKNPVVMGIFLVLVGPFYFYKALRNFYKQSRFVTILKFIMLNIVFTIGANLTALIFFAVSAAIY